MNRNRQQKPQPLSSEQLVQLQKVEAYVLAAINDYLKSTADSWIDKMEIQHVVHDNLKWIVVESSYTFTSAQVERGLTTYLMFTPGKQTELGVAEWYEYRWIPIFAEAFPDLNVKAWFD